MSSEDSRRVSLEDIQLVQNLIEQCLQLYMSQKEATDTLLAKARIEPAFTELVWQKLEVENPEFFKEYHLRLTVKDQILLFNRLLEKQAEFMKQLSNGPTAIDMSNGSHNALMNQNSACYGKEHIGSSLQAGDMHQPLNSSLYSNGGTSSMYMQGTVDISDDDKRKKSSSNMLMANSYMGYMQGTVDISGDDKRKKSPSNMLMTNGSNMGYVQGTVDISNDDKRNKSSSNMLMTNSSNMGYVQGMNRQMMKPDIGYTNGSPYMFGPNVNVLDARYAAVEMPISSYSSVDPRSQPINNSTLFGADATYESLGKIPKTGVSYSSVEPHSQPINNSTLFGADATYESLGKIPKCFSLSDLTADFCLSSDILESFSGSPFLATGSDSFMNPQLQVQQQDNRSLDTKVEGYTYHNFKRQ